MGRGRLWRWDGRRFWWWSGGRGSADWPWCSDSREGDSPTSPSSAPPPLPSVEGSSKCWPRAPRSHSTYTCHTQSFEWAGPWRMDLWRAVQTGRMSLYTSCHILSYISIYNVIVPEEATHHLTELDGEADVIIMETNILQKCGLKKAEEIWICCENIVEKCGRYRLSVHQWESEVNFRFCQ